jgi:hypothetical protein
MLMNSLSLDEEEAVQAELTALQHETVSYSCLVRYNLVVSRPLITTLVTCPGQRGTTTHTPRRTYNRTYIFGRR